LEKNEKSVLEAQAMNIANMVEYQEGSIVSKTLIDKKAGTITFFAFDESQGLSEHIAPYDALLNVLDGEAQVTISKKIFTLKSGEMIILPANKPHAVKATKKFKMMLVMIKA
jgi:quercetin dioxygenase-like cupin family protein